ncbi:MAG TPA: AMP-binding protein [Solirubrobacteraceae bacterium]|nr:AMP-binding protein [Solirubrobacteraceae bacterium]
MAHAIEPRIRPFDMTGIERGDDGIARYVDRPDSLVAMLRATVERAPEVEAVVELGGERLTYRELWDRAARVAGGLRAAGVSRGDRVASRLPNGVDWCLAFFGAQLAGAVIVPVNTRFTEPEIEYVIDDSGAGHTFMPEQALPDGDPLVVDDLAPDDQAAIFYTSGTTGFPKGAMTSHANFLANTENARRVVGLPDQPGLRSLVSVPLFHVTGCNSQLLVSCELAGTTVIMPTFQVQAFLEAIRDERIELLTSVPAIYWLAISQPDFGELDTSGVRWATYGGAPIAPELVRRIMEAFPNARVGNGFGLTETSSISTFLPHEYAESHPESVGLAAPVVDLDLLEPASDTGVGELLIRGPNVVAGYWNKPEQTAETFVDGWLHSGDLARIDKDGFVQIVDRSKDMINRGGENVYCVEVENVLAAHSDVFEVAVVGVPDEMMGEKVGAVVVPRPGAQLDVDDLLSFARRQLADFKVPQYVVVDDHELPRNPGGKVVKPTLRERSDWSDAAVSGGRRAR